MHLVSVPAEGMEGRGDSNVAKRGFQRTYSPVEQTKVYPVVTANLSGIWFSSPLVYSTHRRKKNRRFLPSELPKGFWNRINYWRKTSVLSRLAWTKEKPLSKAYSSSPFNSAYQPSFETQPLAFPSSTAAKTSNAPEFQTRGEKRGNICDV